ncbi:radical SAM/SPASM domain-containing protein [Chitinophaga tropicalis]|uniref:Radical SAM protein n=1 Tax=Chitinophaga tropicalis TaxID=2683588 RepID=A0A7K1UD42_9BACT|nr:radical SAM protein [Chitinophaga tropicalis]MVT12297.1 radical SAM protein [Chitinophaga tropicalis]
MKLSRFNTAVPYGEEIVYHNSYTNKFLLIDSFLYELVSAGKTPAALEELKEIHQEFFDALVEYGFIVENDTDELQNVRNLIDSVDNQDNYFHLIVNPTMNCNFSCWYCYENHEKKSKITDEVIDKIELLLENIFTQNPKLEKLSLSFFGGEPLLFYNKMSELMKKAKAITDKYGKELLISITSNGLLIDQEIIEELKGYNVGGFQITLDGNREKHDLVRFVSKSKGSYDKIIANVKALARNGFVITLRINFTKENLIGLEDVIDDLADLTVEEKKMISLSMQKVFQEPGTPELVESVAIFKEYAKKNHIHHRSAVLADTVRSSCYADKKNEAVINYNGDVYKCNARDFNQKNKEGVLNEKGEIIWNEQHNKRLIPKLTNKPCLECSILPICGGGCSQMIIENIGKDYCVHEFDEDSKKRLVLEMFLDQETQLI